MNNFKIGDKVKIKYFTEEEYNNLPYTKKSWIQYTSYIDLYTTYKDEIFIIDRIYRESSELIFKLKHFFYNFTEYELEKVADLKDKFKYILKM